MNIPSSLNIGVKLFSLIFILHFSCASAAQIGYLSYSNLVNELNTISNHPKATLKSYGKSYGGKDLWALTIGKQGSPALLIVAGLDGHHQVGTPMSVLLAKSFLETDSLIMSLEDKSIIFIANGNPDALDAYFAKNKFEKSGNARPTDDNRNGKTGDDGYDDLNNDGLITWMRVESAAGTHIINEKDARWMSKPDTESGKRATHLLFTEGIDNNKNGLFNEDASLGVNIDKNFAFDYPAFKSQAGEYAVSESETRALMDFIFENQNIHTIINFGPHNNLSEPEKFNAKSAEERIIKSWLETDVKVSETISKLYNNSTSLKDAPKTSHQSGSFVQTAYYHTGNFSFSSPLWWAALPKDDKKDTSVVSKDIAKPITEKDDYEMTFLKWADAHQITDIFVPWKEVKHPDFPKNKVEVGGIKPYVIQNPPIKFINELVEGHTKFINNVLIKMPTHEIVEPKVEELSPGLYRITIKTVNSGGLPSYASINDKFKFTSRLKTQIDLDKNQSMVSGRKITLSNSLQPNDSEQYSWLISGKGKVTITSGCAKTGESSIQLNLN